jgi:hypothetical protein
MTTPEEQARLVTVEVKQQFFEKTLIENVNTDMKQMHEAIMQLTQDIIELRMKYEKHSAVQTSWQRFTVPIISTVVGSGLVAFFTALLVGVV